jgi:acetoacetyl-CoA synthetase
MHQYSVTKRSNFWAFLWDYSGLIHEGNYTQVVDESARMDSVPIWFDGIKLNFAENILLPLRSQSGKEDNTIAVSEFNELGLASRVTLTWGALRRRVGLLANAMRAQGVVKGDRIASCSCNNIDTLIVFLATTALGAIFSSSSTDIGVSGILQRLQQIEPRWVFMDDTALYNGKRIDLLGKMTEVTVGLQKTPGFRGLISLARFKSQQKDVSGIPMVQTFAEFVSKSNGRSELFFERVDFRDPFLIVYSSGTTGAPKCIVHSVGGALLNSFKEGGLHQEFGPRSVSLQYTTTSWIMYFATISSLLLGTQVVLYDGSPFLPNSTVLLELAAHERLVSDADSTCSG